MTLASRFSRPPRPPGRCEPPRPPAELETPAPLAGTAPEGDEGMTVAQALRGMGMATAALNQLEATSSHPARKMIGLTGRRALAEAKRILRRHQ